MSKIIELGINLSMLLTGKVPQGLAQATQAIGKLQAKIKGYQGNLDKINRYQKANAKLMELTNKLNEGHQGGWDNSRLYAQYQKQIELVNKYGEELKRTGHDIRDLSGAEQGYAYSLENTANKLSKIQAAQDRYNQIKSQLFDWQNIKADFIKSAALIKTFEKPIKVHMDFEQAMANVKAVMDVSDAEKNFAKLSNLAMDLGAKTQFTGVQVAESMENLVRAGYNSQEVSEVIEPLLTLSAADNVSLPETAAIISKTINMLGLDKNQAGRVADLYAYTSASAQTDTKMLGQAMLEFAPMVRKLNMDAEEAFALLGGIANVSKDGGESGLAVTRALERLMKEPKQAFEAMHKLGIATSDREGNMRKLPLILQDLNDKLSKYGSKEQGKYMSQIFGQFSTPLSSLMKAVTSGEVGKLETGLYTQSQGKAQSMEQVRNDTLKGDLIKLESAWEGFMNRVGKPLEGWSRNIVQGITGALTKVNEFIKNNEKLMDIAVKVAAVFASWKIIGTAYKYAKLLFELFQTMTTIKALTGGASIINKLSSAFGLLSTAMAANPFGAFIVGAIAAVWFCGYVMRHWQDICDFAAKTWDWLKSGWAEFAAWWDSLSFKDIFAPVVQAAWQLWEDIKAPFIAMYDWIKDLFASLNPFANYKPSAELLEAQKHAAPDPKTMGTNHRARALGGMITRPEIALIGEDGPEAIIPLSKPSRGMQVLNYAAERLGVNIIPQHSQPVSTHIANTRINEFTRNANIQEGNYTASNINDYSRALERPYTQNINQGGTYTSEIKPNINITVNASGNPEGESGMRTFAGDIASRVKEALSEIMEREARLSFA